MCPRGQSRCVENRKRGRGRYERKPPPLSLGPGGRAGRDRRPPGRGWAGDRGDAAFAKPFGSNAATHSLSDNSPLPTPPAAGPVTASGASVADDPATHRVVLFGGVNSTNKTWLWDGRHWTSTTPPSSPPNRAGAAAAYDPATRMVMLFGGSGPTLGQVAQLFNDTWAWTGSTWRRLNSGGAHGPPIGDGAQMAWDDTRHQMLLVTPAGTLNAAETWIWDGSTWRRQPKGNIAAIAFGVMAYDPASHAVVRVSPLIGDNSHSATFSLNGSSWRALVTDGPPVDGFAIDPLGNDLEACGASTYSPAFAIHASCWQWTEINWVPAQVSLPSDSHPVRDHRRRG